MYKGLEDTQVKKYIDEQVKNTFMKSQIVLSDHCAVTWLNFPGDKIVLRLYSDPLVPDSPKTQNPRFRDSGLPLAA
jgi:hypothetical protein